MFRAPGCRLRLGRNTSHNSGGATGKAVYWILAAVACLVLSTQSWDLARIEMCGVRPPAEPTPMGWRGEAAHSVNGTYMLSERGRRGQRATVFIRFFGEEGQPLVPDPDTGVILIFTVNVSNLDSTLIIAQLLVFGISLAAYLGIAWILAWVGRRLLARVHLWRVHDGRDGNAARGSQWTTPVGGQNDNAAASGSRSWEEPTERQGHRP